MMKKIAAFVLLVCLTVLPLAACTLNNPTTTYKASSAVATSPGTSMMSTVGTSPMTSMASTSTANQANTTRYLHGKITSVSGNSISLSDVPQYGTCTVTVDTATKFTGVTKVGELKANQLVIITYMANGTMSSTPAASSMTSAASTAASATTTAKSASPAASATPGAGPNAAPQNITATAVEMVATLPTLTGKITAVNTGSFLMEDATQGQVQVSYTEFTLMDGITTPAKDDTVTVVYYGQLSKSSPPQVTAISIKKGSASNTSSPVASSTTAKK